MVFTESRLSIVKYMFIEQVVFPIYYQSIDNFHMFSIWKNNKKLANTIADKGGLFNIPLTESAYVLEALPVTAVTINRRRLE